MDLIALFNNANLKALFTMANLGMILAAIINAISNRLLQFHDDLTVI